MSLSRIGIILDSIQSDVMQVNKGTKEVVLESKCSTSVDKTIKEIALGVSYSIIYVVKSCAVWDAFDGLSTSCLA